MPEATKGHGNHQVEIEAWRRDTRTTEWDKEIVAQPRGERDVPTVPKLGRVGGLIGAAEVLRDAVAE